MRIDRPRWPADRSGSVRASSMSTSARPANVAHVFTPLTSQPPSVGRRGDLHAGDVGAVVGLGHHDADHHLAARDARQPRLLLLLGAARDERAREDLGPGDERAADAERAARQLLGRDDHAHVVGLAAGREPAVLLGHREAEPAELGEPGDDLLGHVGVGAVHVLGRRAGSCRRRSGGRSRRRARSRRRGASGPLPCFTHWSASDSRNAGARCSATNGIAPASASGSTSHAALRPSARVATSCTASATYARASIDSTSPCSP